MHWEIDLISKPLGTALPGQGNDEQKGLVGRIPGISRLNSTHFLTILHMKGTLKVCDGE